MSLRAVSIGVFGRVQGVWFRASTKTVADKLQIKGFVSNAPDGSVYIEASGSRDAIEQFIVWCEKGPELARVDRVVVKDIQMTAYSTFDIRR